MTKILSWIALNIYNDNSAKSMNRDEGGKQTNSCTNSSECLPSIFFSDSLITKCSSLSHKC